MGRRPDRRQGQELAGARRIGDGAVADDEDLLPLFPLRYPTDGRTRTLFVGLVPTTSADAFKAAGPAAPASPLHGSTRAGVGAGDPRPAALKAKVTDPLRALIATQTAAPADAPASKQTAIEQAMAGSARSRRRASSCSTLAEFLHDNLGWFATDVDDTVGPEGARRSGARSPRRP